MCNKIKVKWKYKQSKGENNKGKQSGGKKTKVNSKVLYIYEGTVYILSSKQRLLNRREIKRKAKVNKG